ncbi:bifunctional riboflavin kinase/FAD synthetase [Halorhodospira halophila]|uniref:Riboflavin biosynthesis protein n=2 Tax=Pseudomonadota TaxID=1224 RepID=A1WY39_HALHL|nr:bifunctional riboflavin kinase/FAD synthetase [Halorhodospira halophila]ABM62601.1 riboflavin biosynthesis protein RibF [Halorhodospira halophila SL1]MBK1728281.1 bifunctional riboflavin kinase/FMN adenylyltransferase [Halorhodospira halophila]
MELIRGLHNVRACHRGAAITIGNFDGVHRGHRAMIDRLREEAARRGCPAVVVTFEPHPMERLAPARAPARLTGLREKVRRLGETGVDAVLCLRFDQHLAAVEAEAFAGELLGGRLGAGFVLVGDDFRFGRQRRGDLEMLRRAGEAWGYEVAPMETVTRSGERVSSTRIREAVRAGRFAEAAELLGHPYCIQGRVVHGDAMGRQLGWPTANLRLSPERIPLDGIYAGWARGGTEQPWPTAISVGIRPTVGGRRTVFEAHLIDFDGDLYGRHLCVEPVVRLRGEAHFDGLDALARQIGEDVRAARRVLGQEHH